MEGFGFEGRAGDGGPYAFAVTFRYIDGVMHAYKGTVTIIK